MSLEELEEEVIREVLRKANWVQKDAARLLKISPRSLNYKIAKYGIKNPRWSKNS
jgi:transcriptional regulator with GAF, ATPase, and Fis domain